MAAAKSRVQRLVGQMSLDTETPTVQPTPTFGNAGLNAYIVDCVRTAGGRKGGRLSKWHPADLGAVVCDELVKRTGINGQDIDDVVFGCVSQIGSQAGNIGRSVVLSCKQIPESVPGVSVDRQCGSGQQAIHFAAQGVMSGTQDMVIAGGIEIMSLVPIGSNILDGLKMKRGHPQGKEINKKYRVQFSQFNGAEILAKKCNVSREEMDKFSVASHQKATNATKKGYFKNELVPVMGWDKKKQKPTLHDVDEGIRMNGVTYEKTASLRTLQPKGRITVATSSQICDGAAAILICNERALKKFNLKPRAKIVGMALAGSDPVTMLYGPIPATQKVLKKTGLSMKDMDLYEVNEAFCSVPLAWAKELGADLDKLNVNGGAMALGHPLGATGAKLMATLVNEMERRGVRYGLEAICEGGGTANATIIERC